MKLSKKIQQTLRTLRKQHQEVVKLEKNGESFTKKVARLEAAQMRS